MVSAAEFPRSEVEARSLQPRVVRVAAGVGRRIQDPAGRPAANARRKIPKRHLDSPSAAVPRRSQARVPRPSVLRAKRICFRARPNIQEATRTAARAALAATPFWEPAARY